MITLAQAFRLCSIEKDEAVYLRHAREKNSGIWVNSYYFNAKKIRDKFDMRAIKVVKIELEFEHFGDDFYGYRFAIEGCSPEELRRIACGI